MLEAVLNTSLNPPLNAPSPAAESADPAAGLRPRAAGRVPWAARGLMLLSGAAGLGWQLVWTAQLGPGLGHEIVAVLAVLAAFFGGLALGALVLGQRIDRSPCAGRWYAACEAVIAVWGLALLWGLPAGAPVWAGWIGAEPSSLRHWAVAFGLPFVLLLPATAAMGATLPALERQLRSATSELGGAYAANTAGALLGVLLVVFAWIPLLGIQHTGLLCAAANALCAAGAMALWGRAGPGLPASQTSPTEIPKPTPHGERALALAVLGATGLLGIGVQVLAVRVLSQVTENTVYSYALLLAVYLLGTAVGAAAYQRWLCRRQSDELRNTLLLALPLGLLLCTAPALMGADVLAALPTRWLGPGPVPALLGEALAAAAALLLPTALMGMLFSHLCIDAQARGIPLGHAVAANTLGAALAPWAIGVALLPAVGAQATGVLLALGFWLLRSPPARHWPSLAAAAGTSICVLAWAPPLRFVDQPAGGQVLTYREGVMATVSVVEDAAGVARLRINNRQQEGSSAAGLVELRLAQLPLLLHPQPHSALFLGLGTGFTATAAAHEPRLQVDAVELLPEVIDAASLFQSRSTAPPPLPPPNVIQADARRFVLASTARYDVIVSDLFHPARSGAGGLYTVEHFAAVRQRLAPGGLFCQWLALHQMDLPTLRGIVAAYLTVFPQAIAVLASNSLDTPVLGLVARPDWPRLDSADAPRRMQGADTEPRRVQARLEDEYALLGSVVAGPSALRQFVAGHAANTDDRPQVSHDAPWATYAPQDTPRQRLLALTGALSLSADEVLVDAHGEDARRLQAYWDARGRYIALGARTPPLADPQAMLRQLQAPLLDILRSSPDFRPAYDPLLALAQAISGSDAPRARALLQALHSLQPARAEATALLRQMP